MMNGIRNDVHKCGDSSTVQCVGADLRRSGFARPHLRGRRAWSAYFWVAALYALMVTSAGAAPVYLGAHPEAAENRVYGVQSFFDPTIVVTRSSSVLTHNYSHKYGESAAVPTFDVNDVDGVGHTVPWSSVATSAGGGFIVAIQTSLVDAATGDSGNANLYGDYAIVKPVTGSWPATLRCYVTPGTYSTWVVSNATVQWLPYGGSYGPPAASVKKIGYTEVGLLLIAKPRSDGSYDAVVLEGFSRLCDPVNLWGYTKVRSTLTSVTNTVPSMGAGYNACGPTQSGAVVQHSNLWRTGAGFSNVSTEVAAAYYARVDSMSPSSTFTGFTDRQADNSSAYSITETVSIDATAAGFAGLSDFKDWLPLIQRKVSDWVGRLYSFLWFLEPLKGG